VLAANTRLLYLIMVVMIREQLIGVSVRRGPSYPLCSSSFCLCPTAVPRINVIHDTHVKTDGELINKRMEQLFHPFVSIKISTCAKKHLVSTTIKVKLVRVRNIICVRTRRRGIGDASQAIWNLFWKLVLEHIIIYVDERTFTFFW